MIKPFRHWACRSESEHGPALREFTWERKKIINRQDGVRIGMCSSEVTALKKGGMASLREMLSRLQECTSRGMEVCVCVCVFVYMCVCVCMCAYMCIHVCTHACMYV